MVASRNRPEDLSTVAGGDRDHAGALRRKASGWFTSFVHTVVAALLVRDGRALLGHRSPDRRWYPDVWDLLGGHVRDGESPQAALVRELDEELGIVVDVELGDPVAHVFESDGEDGGFALSSGS